MIIKQTRDSSSKYSDEDFSYPTPEIQLRWRLEDLKSRLDELLHNKIMQESWSNTCNNDLRYTLPEDLYSIKDIEAAIELAKYDLKEKYKIFEEEQTTKIVFFPPLKVLSPSSTQTT